MLGDDQLKVRLRSVSVLIVEDDRIVTTLIKDILTVLGFGKIESVTDGGAALKVMHDQKFDMVICDWKMSPMNGIQFVKYLRQSEESPDRFIPVLMLTGMASVENVREARDIGVNEYLVKPFSVAALCAKVKAIVEESRFYIVGDNYTGPDRRRRDQKPPDGTDRRRR